MIASLAKAVQFNAEEVKDCKNKIDKLDSHSELLIKENKELVERIREQERYKMRWCLKLKGLKEKNDENIRTDIIHLFANIAPDMEKRQLEDTIDIVHRVGRKDGDKNRQVIILFARRLVTEEIWRRSKDSPACKERNIRFAEMLPLEDREARKVAGETGGWYVHASVLV